MIWWICSFSLACERQSEQMCDDLRRWRSARQRRVDEVQNPAVQEDAQDPEEHHDDEADEQHAVTGSEVIF